MKNIELLPFRKASAFRRIAAVAWDAPSDPTIYGSIQVRAEKLLAWIERKRAETGERLTITHAAARALAIVLRRHPDLNAIVRRNRLYLRRDVDIFVQVALPAEEKGGSADLSGVMVRQADTKDIGTLAREIREGATRIRSGKDADFQRTKAQAFSLPPLLFRWALRFLAFLQYTLNIDPRFLGAPKDPFGSAMVTSLGMMGVNLGYAPFFPLSRTPMILMLGAVEDVVIAEEGRPVVVKAFRLNGTMDHRVIDGLHAAILSREIRELLENPENLEVDRGGGGGS